MVDTKTSMPNSSFIYRKTIKFIEAQQVKNILNKDYRVAY